MSEIQPALSAEDVLLLRDALDATYRPTVSLAEWLGREPTPEDIARWEAINDDLPPREQTPD